MGQFAICADLSGCLRSRMSPPPTRTRSTPARGSTCRKEPYVLSLPDEGDRYYLIPMLDGWTDVFQVPGKRTTGDKAQTVRHHGSRLEGQAAAGRQGIQIANQHGVDPRPHYCTGTPEDYEAVHAIQDEYKLVPLSAYGKPYTPPEGKVDPSIDMKTPVRDQVNGLTAEAYFSLLATLLKDNPPAKADAPMVAKLTKLGVVPGAGFRREQARRRRREGAGRGSQDSAFEKIMGHFKKRAPM